MQLPKLNVIKETCPKWYRLKIFTFGILTINLVLEHFEELENYEECAKIMKAIKEHEEWMGEALPTRTDKVDIEGIKKEFKRFNLTGEFIERSSLVYKGYILDEVKAMAI